MRSLHHLLLKWMKTERHSDMLRLGITNEAYHADPALGRSVADCLLTTCPAKVKYAMGQPSPSSPCTLEWWYDP